MDRFFILKKLSIYTDYENVCMHFMDEFLIACSSRLSGKSRKKASCAWPVASMKIETCPKYLNDSLECFDCMLSLYFSPLLCCYSLYSHHLSLVRPMWRLYLMRLPRIRSSCTQLIRLRYAACGIDDREDPFCHSYLLSTHPLAMLSAWYQAVCSTCSHCKCMDSSFFPIFFSFSGLILPS